MELAFHDEPISVEIDQLVESRLHTDDARNEENRDFNRELQLRLAKNTATPTYVLIDPETEEVLDVFLGARQTDAGLEEFATFLRKGREAYVASKEKNP